MPGPWVAYLLDGDAGGDAHAKRLAAAGIPKSRIIQIGGQGSGLCVEDLLRDEVYIKAVNEVLLRITGVGGFGARDMHGNARNKALELWCASKGLAVPGKPAVAAAILDGPPTRYLTRHSAGIVRTIHNQLSEAFGF